MYPNHSYAGYHSNAMGSWNKANMPQNSQGIGYAAFPYTLPDVTSFVEKATYHSPYGTLYAAVENECYRQHYANPGSQPPHWTPSNFQHYVPAHQYRRPVADGYNHRHCPNLPNTARPPPSIKTESADNTFHASLSMLENPTQNSAAAYTANWVSNTSSIPPELRDEPERDDLAAGASAVFTPPASSFAEQFSNLSVNEKWENNAALSMQQWPGLEQGRNGGSVPGSQGERRRTEGRERYARHSPKELTWEERIRKGAVQKERIEQRGLERPERTERDGRENNSGSGRHKGQRGGRSSAVAKSERTEKEQLPSPTSVERDMTTCRNQLTAKGTRTHGNRQGDKRHKLERKPRMVQMRPPQYYRHGVPLLMCPSTYYNTGHNLVPCIAQQDQRFRNTWLDANLGLNYPVQMVDYTAFAPHRPRPLSRGRSGYRYSCKHTHNAKEPSKTEDQDSSGADQGEEMRSGLEQEESVKAEEEEVWGFETEEEKQKRHGTGFNCPLEMERSEKEQTEEEGKLNATANELCSNSTTSSISKPEVSDTSISR